MFRLTLIPFILLFSTVFLGIIGFLFVRKIKKGFNFTVKKGSDFVKTYQKRKDEKQQRKKLPDILQQGLDRYDQLRKSHLSLPLEWKILLEPLVKQAKEILDEVSKEQYANPDNMEGNLNSDVENIKINSIRPFFNHTLDALLQFSQKINADYTLMDDHQVEKARQNITAFKADLLRHQEVLRKAKRLDFDVLMDVIKARLKK